jgi:hypothetical protein
MVTKRRIKKAIKYYRERCTYLREILDFCDLNGYNYAFVGGFIKWCLDKNFESTGPRDLDIIIDMPKEELLWFLDSNKIRFRKNDCGGCKIFPHKDDDTQKELDVWTLDSHQPFIPFERTVEYRNIKRTFKNVTETSWLSTDGAIYDVNKNKLYARECKKSLKEKCVKFQHYNIYKKSAYVEFKVGIVAKILKLIHDGWNFDENCLYVLTDFFKKKDETKLVKYMEKHYANQFIDWHNEVIKYKNILNKKF